jgi:hypothetical protein
VPDIHVFSSIIYHPQKIFPLSHFLEREIIPVIFKSLLKGIPFHPDLRNTVKAPCISRAFCALWASPEPPIDMGFFPKVL